MPDPKLTKNENREYLNWIISLECLICGIKPSDPHHVRHARSNDFMAVPLCRKHHSEYHSVGHKSFEDKYLIDFNWIIIETLSRYIKQRIRNDQRQTWHFEEEI